MDQIPGLEWKDDPTPPMDPKEKQARTIEDLLNMSPELDKLLDEQQPPGSKKKEYTGMLENVGSWDKLIPFLAARDFKPNSLIESQNVEDRRAYPMTQEDIDYFSATYEGPSEARKGIYDRLRKEALGKREKGDLLPLPEEVDNELWNKSWDIALDQAGLPPRSKAKEGLPDIGPKEDVVVMAPKEETEADYQFRKLKEEWKNMSDDDLMISIKEFLKQSEKRTEEIMKKLDKKED